MDIDTMGTQNLRLNEVWRACRKVQAALFQYGFDLCAEFCPHDPHNHGLVSEAVFCNVLGKYKRVIGLSDFALKELSDYFRLTDGRVAYRQFCKAVAEEPHSKACDPHMTAGLEWNDPMHVNILPRPEDRRRLCLLLIKIAQQDLLPLLPYFQDYELVVKYSGCCSVTHFSRVLHFLKMHMSDDEFLLLLKRYMVDSHLINYVAFTKHLQNIIEYLKSKRLIDSSKKILNNFPGRLIDLELPVIPPINGSNMTNRLFRETCDHGKDSKTDCDVVACIQKHVHKNSVRVREFLEGFDPLRTGTITRNQFERGLHNMGVGKHLNQRDFQVLCMRYIDPIDSNRIVWRAFEDEIDIVFTIKELEKMPDLIVKSPPKHIAELPMPGSLIWDDARPTLREVCEETLVKIQTRIRNRRLHLHPFFRSFDKLNSGQVNCRQANQVLLMNGILLSDMELESLKGRYGSEMGFNYTMFLQHADPAEYAIPQLLPKLPEVKLSCPDKEGKQKKQLNASEREQNIIRALSKAKRQVVTKNVPLLDFLQDFDRHRESQILESDFKRALNNANVIMTPEESDLLCELFRSPRRGCCVLYRDFVKAMNEIFLKVEAETGDKETLAIPIMHLPNLECVECFLNFDERTICSQALIKLARKPDEISNLSSIFKDFDRTNCGTITQNQFMRALATRDMHYIISSREFEVVCKCFGHERGGRMEFSYRDFLYLLSALFQNSQMKRNI